MLIALLEWLFADDLAPAHNLGPVQVRHNTRLVILPRCHIKKSAIFLAIVLFLTPAFSQSNIITTIAGTDWLFPGDGRRAIDAPIGGVFNLGLAVDQHGAVFIADEDNQMVFKVTPDGVLSVVAGNGIIGHTGDGGPATSAALLSPFSVAVDSSDNLYFLDSSGGYVRKVTPDGVIGTIAGTGNSGYNGDNIPATSASFYHPYALTLDSAGSIYIADSYNNRVRKITPDGIVTTVAGNGKAGYNGDNIQATSASLNFPIGVIVDAAGNLYIADADNALVRMVSPQGIITTVAGVVPGSGPGSFADNIPALSAFVIPKQVAIDAAGNLLLSDFATNRVRKVAGGVITTIAGNGTQDFGGDGGPAVQAAFNNPTGLAVDADGNIYIGDSSNERVRKLTLDGNIGTVAGNGLFRYAGDGGPATSATLYLPYSIAQDKSGSLYIVEPEQSRVRKVAPNGIITTFAGTGEQGFNGDNIPATSAKLWFPSGVAVDGIGAVYIGDQLNERIRRVAPDGTIGTVAANLNGPQAVLIDPNGNLFISETYGNIVRKITPAGVSAIYAGNGKKGFSGDGGPATEAAFNAPAGLGIDPQGNLYIADSLNHRIRKVTPQGVISTLAGNGNQDFSGDGGQAIRAALDTPSAVIADAAGNVYIGDTNNFRIREVTPDGIIHTIAGVAKKQFSGDGGPASQANITGPIALLFDPAGDLLVADWFNHRIRSILVAPPTFQSSPGTLTFSAESDGLPSPAQTVQVDGSIPGLLFGTAVTPTDSAPWLQVTPLQGLMPGGAQVSADPTGLAPGTYHATFNAVSPYTQPILRTAAVTFTVTPARPAHLAAKPDGLSFSLVQTAPSATQALTVSNQGGGSLDFTTNAATVSGGNWLTVSPGSGTSTVASSTALQATANPAGLAPGTYSGAVTVASSTTAETITIPVVMTVSAVQQTIRLLQTGLTFTAVVGGGVTPPQTFGVQNIGQGIMSWSASASVLAGPSSWLSATPDSGSSDAASTDSPSVQVSVDPTSLAAGNYYGQVSLSAPGADNSPQAVSVVLNVLPAGSDPGPIVQPSGLIFTGVAGSESPGSQLVTVSNLANAALTFTSGQTTLDGNNWFAYLPTRATLTAQQSRRIVVQPYLSGLDPGIYHGAVTLSFPGGVTRAVSLLFVVTSTSVSSLSSHQNRDRQGAVLSSQGGCTPSQLAPIFTSLSDSFAVAAAWPSTLGVRVIDDCGSPMLSGSAVATFSNGDPPQVLKHSQNGNWSGTWQPRAVSAAPVTVRVSAEIPEQQLKGSAQISGALRTNQSVPSITPGAVLSSASLKAQSPIAPGSLISILGSSLSDSSLSANTQPLPMGLAGTSVLIAGRPAPIASVSDGRIDAIVPYDVPPNTQHQIIVQKGAVATVPETVTVAPAQPAIFTQDKSGTGQGSVYVLRADGTQVLANAANPVATGDNILIQCAGLGAVSPGVDAGTVTPDSPPSMTVNAVKVTIGGVDAPVTFAELQPGLTGVYRVRATVPDGVGAGNDVPIIISAAGQLSQGVTIAVH
jgi:uncharacterized protein (TIGR03437 family)